MIASLYASSRVLIRSSAKRRF